MGALHEVRAETHDGKVMVLRRFVTRDEAEEHPVKMKHWRRVWVERVDAVAKAEITDPPPFPWTVEWVGSFAYVLDATGKKIASLLGPQKQREFVAAILCDLPEPPK